MGGTFKRQEYPDIEAFGRAAGAALLAVATGRRTADDFTAWMRMVTVDGMGLEPETHRAVICICAYCEGVAAK